MAYGVLNTSVASAIGESENEGLLTENRLAQKRKMTDKLEKARQGAKKSKENHPQAQQREFQVRGHKILVPLKHFTISGSQDQMQNASLTYHRKSFLSICAQNSIHASEQ